MTMSKRKQIIASLLLLSAQTICQAIAAPSGPSGGIEAPLTAPGGVTDVHSGTISVSEPLLTVPTGGVSSSQPLIIPGGVTSKGGVVPAINPLSLAPRTIDSGTAAKPSAAFLSPESETELSLKYGTLHLMPGSLVLLVSAEDTVAVYDLHDGKDSDVFVECEGQKFPLTPGREVTLASARHEDFASACPMPFVAYYPPEKKQISAGVVSFTCKYDVYTLIFRYKPFRELLTSTNPKLRKVAEKVLKTSSIMSNITANARYYSGGSVPIVQPVPLK
jgi:hypothetical protein